MQIRLTESDLRQIVESALANIQELCDEYVPTYKMDVYGEPTWFNASDVVAAIVKIINKLTRNGGDTYFRLKLFFHKTEKATAWVRYDREVRMETPVDLDISFTDGDNNDNEYALRFVLIRNISAKYEGDPLHPYAVAVAKEISHKKTDIEYYINGKH